jgi:large subunit ribosomal protein L6
MSRIGKRPIEVPKAVTVSVDAENWVTVKGPKGTLTERIPAEITVNIGDGSIEVTRPSDSRQHFTACRAR